MVMVSTAPTCSAHAGAARVMEPVRVKFRDLEVPPDGRPGGELKADARGDV